MPTERAGERRDRLWPYHLAALATVLIWSFSFLFIIRLNEHLSPLGVVVVRKDIFLVLVIGLIIWRRPPIRQLTRRDWALLIGLALVSGPTYHVVFAWSAGQYAPGRSRIDPGLLGLILATVPVHASWLAWIFLKERLTAIKVIALVFGLLGVATVLYGRFGRLDLLPREHLEGPMGATLSAILGAGTVVLTRAARRIYPPIDLVAVSGALIVLFCSVLHPVADLQRVASMSAAGWFAALFLGIMGSGVAFLTWATALSRLQSVTVAMYLFLASVLAALWGYLFNGTPVGLAFVAGGALVLIGLLLMASQSRPGAVSSAP